MISARWSVLSCIIDSESLYNMFVSSLIAPAYHWSGEEFETLCFKRMNRATARIHGVQDKVKRSIYGITLINSSSSEDAFLRFTIHTAVLCVLLYKDTLLQIHN